ncbi:MAG: NUDIX domain-containing protein [Bacteroidia bacterium]|nr:NUDIX domain-containing protein [Bacteroidia bacterium]
MELDDMGPQSYKIYFNEGALVIAESPSDLKGLSNLYYIGDDELHKSFKILTNSQTTGKVLNFGLISPDPEATFNEFVEEYRVIQAAGGLVFNKEGQLLTIKRNGLWDMPKGKIEKHEDQRAAALREVMEETGINMINISEKVGQTYHAYIEDEATMLKETHWYFMNASGKSKLKPQVEEGISEVKWADLDWFKSAEFETYQSIQDIVTKALQQQQAVAASV